MGPVSIFQVMFVQIFTSSSIVAFNIDVFFVSNLLMLTWIYQSKKQSKKQIWCIQVSHEILSYKKSCLQKCPLNQASTSYPLTFDDDKSIDNSAWLVFLPCFLVFFNTYFIQIFKFFVENIEVPQTLFQGSVKKFVGRCDRRNKYF